MKQVLAIGGLDSSCGAGVIRDAATIQSLGKQPRVAVTAVTAQTATGVQDIHPVPSQTLDAQIVPAHAIKIGMLCDDIRVRTVCRALENLSPCPSVLDPVLSASTGGRLLSDAGAGWLLTELIQKVTLITPNLQELSLLADWCGEQSQDPLKQADALRRAGAAAVLIKDGHGSGKVAKDRLVMDGESHVFEAPRLGVSRRGTGCTLASAIACGLAEGRSLPRACEIGKSAVTAYLSEAA